LRIFKTYRDDNDTLVAWGLGTDFDSYFHYSDIFEPCDHLVCLCPRMMFTHFTKISSWKCSDNATYPCHMVDNMKRATRA